MIRDDIGFKYYDWIIGLISDHHPKRKRYSKLLAHLHIKEFTYSIPMDANREEDGVRLRYSFGRQNDYTNALIKEYLDHDETCSVLEMMVALANRCETTIMTDCEMGNRTGYWFWSMINNLGLLSMDDNHYDPEHVEYILDRLLNREYEPNGEGGLVTLHNRIEDLRDVEIWYQMMWYLSENYSHY